MHFRADVASESEVPFETIVPGRTLLRFLDAVDGDTVSLDVDEASATTRVCCGDVELTVRQFDLSEWPQEDLATEVSVKLDATDLAMIRRILFAASASADRGVLAGVHFGDRYATATDNYRLARAKLTADLPECVVPADFLALALKAADGADGIQFDLGSQRVRLSDGTGFWSSQRLIGDYPDVSVVLALATSGEIRFERAALKDAIDRALVLDGVDLVHLTIADEASALVTAGDAEAGLIEERLVCSADWVGEKTFLLAHLRDAIRAVDDEVVVLRPSTHLRPVLVPGGDVEQSLLPRKRA